MCVCLTASSIINTKKNELNIMVEDIDPHIAGITNKDIADAKLVRIGRRGGVLFYILKNLFRLIWEYIIVGDFNQGHTQF